MSRFRISLQSPGCIPSQEMVSLKLTITEPEGTCVMAWDGAVAQR
jgi:hypothetical protein